MAEDASSAPGGDVEAELDSALAQLSGVLLSAETVDTALRLVTSLARTTLPASVGAGLTVVDERGKRSRAVTDAVVEQADSLQYVLDEGPCLTARAEQRIVRIDNTVTESRWPRWTAAVAPLGVRSMLSAPMTAGGEAVGAIKVYSDVPAAFDVRAEQVLGLLAEQAAILVANVLTHDVSRRLNESLTEALRNRDVIGQAKGVLMAQGAADEDEAFAMLVGASQRSHQKLSEVARQLVAAVAARSRTDPSAT